MSADIYWEEACQKAWWQVDVAKNRALEPKATFLVFNEA